jgi:predicted PurR-regulated permease PerM
MDKQINISIKTIVFTLLLVVAMYVVYRLGPVIGILLIATLLVVAMEPFIKKLMKIYLFNKPISRGFAVIICYVLLILTLVAVATLGIPPVLSQLQKMLISLSGIVGNLNLGNNLSLSLSDFIPQISKFSSGVISVTFSVFSNITTLFSLLILSIYLSTDWIHIKRQLISLFPDGKEEAVEETINTIEVSVSHWVKGELILMLVVGSACFVGLEILGIKYALALGIVAGFLEIVPILGPVISAVLAAIIAFADSPIKGLGVIALFILVQQLENNILVPKIMQKVSGFSPLVILLALLIGSEFFGITGAIISVPATLVISVIVKRLLRGDN